MEDNDIHNMCSVRFIDSVKKKAKYLLHSLTIMLETRDSNPTLTWFKACVAAIDKVKQFEFSHLCSEDDNDYTDQWPKTNIIMRWFRQFRDNNESYINTP